jgi:hypothetical protein
MMAVFPTATEGLDAAIAAQRGLASASLGRDRPVARPNGDQRR